MLTKYPIVLVHGFFGFDKIGGISYFYNIQEALEKIGNIVFTSTISLDNSNEVLGEQLNKEIDKIILSIGVKKVNLIGHSQGALACRYVAANYPYKVASMTSINGVNHGSEIADLVMKILKSGLINETLSISLLDSLGGVISIVSGRPENPKNFEAALSALTTSSVEAFNKKYPQGVPRTWGGEGNYIENDVRYFSIGGYIKEGILNQGENFFDPLHTSLTLLSKFFTKEKEHNDGLVGRYSQHLGKVIKSDYNMDHLDSINQLLGITSRNLNVPLIYTKHSEYLSSLGL